MMVVDNESSRSGRRQARRRLLFQLPQFPRKNSSQPVARIEDDDDDVKTTSTSSSSSADPKVLVFDDSAFEDAPWTPPLSECDNWFRNVQQVPDEELIERIVTSAPARHAGESNAVYRWDRNSPVPDMDSKFDDHFAEKDSGPSMMVFRDDIAVHDEDQENEHLLGTDVEPTQVAHRQRRRSGFPLLFSSRQTKNSTATATREKCSKISTYGEDKDLLREWKDNIFSRQLAFDIDSFQAEDVVLEEFEPPQWALQADDILDTSTPPEPLVNSSYLRQRSSSDELDGYKLLLCSPGHDSTVDEKAAQCLTSPEVTPEKEKSQSPTQSSVPSPHTLSQNASKSCRRRRKKKPVKRKPDAPLRASSFRCELRTVVEESPSDDEEDISMLASSTLLGKKILSGALEGFKDNREGCRIEI